MKNKKYPIWFYFVLVILPIVLLFLLEFTLRIFDYGENLEQWIETEENRLVLNPNIAGRYFTKIKNYPHSNNDSFEKEKQANTYRIFVMGGSTTAGFPYSPNGGFSRYIRDRLEIDLPNYNIEVINLGITAVNTYTILDLLPGVIDQSPDLILLYAGHNEYYGALGAASTESIINSPAIINTYLKLSGYKTIQLLKDIIYSSMNLFNSNAKKDTGSTLMARMASEQTIELNSDLYNDGVAQFETNLESILNLSKENNVPVLIGTLASNIKDQKPFVSTTHNNVSAEQTFFYGLSQLKQNKFQRADSLLNYAKDLDGLRFRAPSKFNEIIKNMSEVYGDYLVNVEQKLKNESPDRIVGNNLMVDHLHPTLDTYLLIGKYFYNSIIENDLLPEKISNNKVAFIQDSLVRNNFSFTKLDSIASNYRIYNLLNDWPFKERNIRLLPKAPKERINLLGYKIVFEQLNWRSAHQKAYRWYFEHNEFKNFADEIRVLLSQYPYKLDYYNFAAEKLLSKKQFNLALYFIEKRNKISPDAFSTKWLGISSLVNKNYKIAIEYFLKSLTYKDNDTQTLYNLALAYYNIGEYKNSERFLKSCLVIEPNNKSANALLNQVNRK